jgi:ADP-ribose pyrophosphatase YjhB (NUDIX family)
MITFERDSGTFNYRAAGIVLDRERVLLTRLEGDDFWFMPGGRVEMLEPARESLRREMREEMDVEVTIERLIWVLENFFEFKGQPYHELGLYFLVSPPKEWERRDVSEFAGYEGDGTKLNFRWFSLDDLDDVRLLPSFLREGLRSIPDGTEHVAHRDEEPF